MDTIYCRPISLGNESVEQAAAAVSDTAVWPAHHLVTADTVIKFAVVTLEKQSAELARMLAAAIRARVANDATTVPVHCCISATQMTRRFKCHTFNVPKNATIQLLSRRYCYDWITQIIRNLQLHRQQIKLLMLMRSLTLKE